MLKDVILWLLAIELIGLAAFPICYRLFPFLRDRGFSIAKPFGLLLLAYPSWLLSVVHVLPSAQWSVALLLGGIMALSGWIFYRNMGGMRAFVTRERTAIIAAELVFLAVFAAWAVYRSYGAAITHTEQPMDFAFLNASVRSFWGQPEDPWLSGSSISYYYFGYWMLGTMTKLAGIMPSVAYNLSLALIPAMGAMGVFGLVYGLVRSEASKVRYAVVGGVVAALLLVVVGNLEGALEFMRANGMGGAGFWDWLRIDGIRGEPTALTDTWRPTDNWWWWRATRVIASFGADNQTTDYTIHEFPAFSYVLGDLHPHVMSVPFVVMFIAVTWNFYRAPLPHLRPFNSGALLFVLVMGFMLAGLAFTNMWDLPVFWSLLVGMVGLKVISEKGVNLGALVMGVAPVALATLAISVALLLPYLIKFSSQFAGFGAVGNDASRPLHLMLVWGVFFVAVIPFIISSFWSTTVRGDWARAAVVALAISLVPYVIWAFFYLDKEAGNMAQIVVRFIHVLPFAMLISITLYTVMWMARLPGPPAGRMFALSLSALGLLLIMGPEMLYVNDSFSGSLERMNTVFKFYYQSWVLLAIASGFAVYYWYSLRGNVYEGVAPVLSDAGPPVAEQPEATVVGPEGGAAPGAPPMPAKKPSSLPRLATLTWGAAFVLLLGLSLYYTPAAAASKADGFKSKPTLDGLAYIEQFDGPEYRAIGFIRGAAEVGSVLLEAVGGDYSAHGRISSSTGVPAVLGWTGHESQWRGSTKPFDGREQDVETIYKTQDVEEAKALLAKYDVNYVYVGSRETLKYGEEGAVKFGTFLETVFTEGGVTVYRVP